MAGVLLGGIPFRSSFRKAIYKRRYGSRRGFREKADKIFYQ